MIETQNPFELPEIPRVLPELIGQSVAITNLRGEIAHLLSRQGRGRRLPTVLLLGETGTGKGLLARAIHRASQRAPRPFVDIDCAAIPETLLEAELFGVERGAFTDARETKPGLFQTARGGTLLLDEVGLLPLTLQGKLLKVVEERAVRRLGSTQSEVVDLWVLAATNVDLVAAARNGSFREDLYHRLAAVTLVLPPLRSREGDVVLLAQHFLDRACTEYGLPPKTLAPDALAALTAYHWPGNVRELANRLERVVLMSGENSVISSKLLALPGVPAPVEVPAASRDTARLRSRVEEFEREHLVEALRAAHGNITMAAARLGLPRNTLRYRMDKLGIGVEGAGDPPARAGRTVPRMSSSSVAPDPVSAPSSSLRRDATRQVVMLRVDVGEEDHRRRATQEAPEFVAAKVHSLGGRMEVREGTRLLATFGVYPCDDAASRAAHAAIAIGKTISARIALHVCEVPVRHANSAFAMDEAHRRQAEAVLENMLSSTEGAPLLCCQTTARLLEGRFELEQMAPAAGTATPAYRLLGHKWPRRQPGNPPSTPFIGRRLRLELLEGLFRRAAAGYGQVVGIVAETGAGKSRLLDEFCQRLEQKQLAHHWARFVPYGRGLADLTVVEVLRQAWHIAHEDGGDVITRKVRAALETLGMDADRWTPYLLVLFGVWAGTGNLTRLSREELKLGVFDALRHVAVEWSRREPLVVEVDDVELFGNTGREFLAYLVDSLPASRILMLSTYRPEHHPPWAAKSYFTQLTLPPLPPDESLALLDTLLPRGTGQLAETIAEKAGGNPLFLEELARSALKGDSSDDPLLPEAVRAVLQARMDSLEAGARRLLQIASVLGRRVPAKLLERVCEERGRLRERLAACKRLELLQEEVVEGELAYAFKSALLWQFAYQSVPPVERQALRRAAGLPD